MTAPYVMALDLGSTSARAVLVDPDGRIVAEARNPVEPLFPRPGWVELDPVALWGAQLDSAKRVLAQAGASAKDVAAIGFTSHRETAFAWDRSTGAPVHNGIMWMSHQTDAIVRRWRGEGLDPEVRARTGLNNDSYFTAPKLAWYMEHVDGFAARARRGELAVGTVDTWVLWNLTGGRSHLTDHSQASRTALLNLAELGWDTTLLAACGIPAEILPPGRRLRQQLRGGRPAAARRGSRAGHPRHRHPRRPAGGPVRPGVLRARRREEHVRHGRGARRQRRRQAEPDGGPHLQRRPGRRAAPPCSRPRAWCSPAARPSSGCGTGSACSGRATTSRHWPAACPTTAGSTSCPRSPGCAPRTGTATPAPPSSGCPWKRRGARRPRGPGGHGLPDPRQRRHARARRRARPRAAGRRRRHPQRPALPVPGRHPRHARRAPERARTHRARRRLPGGLGRRAAGGCPTTSRRRGPSTGSSNRRCPRTDEPSCYDGWCAAVRHVPRRCRRQTSPLPDERTPR